MDPSNSVGQQINLMRQGVLFVWRTWQNRKLQSHEATGHSVISFDFFFCTRMKDESDRLTVLVLSDRDTGLCLALPTLQKGGRSLSYLVTEMCRFIVHCGHTEVGLGCDGEPSTLALLEAVRRACAGLRIVVHAEPAPTGYHQANGAAEAMVGVLRSKANLLVSQIEEVMDPYSDVFTQFMHGRLFTALGCTTASQCGML